jgi:hypothetical protein
MGVTEEGTSMREESKMKARLPGIKVIGLFYFGKTKYRGFFCVDQYKILKLKLLGAIRTEPSLRKKVQLHGSLLWENT